MKKMAFKDVFAKEWALYRKEYPAKREGVESLPKVRFGTIFDGGVKKGEVRLFADAVPPRMALVYEEDGPGSLQVIPVSEFTVPANDTEALIGNKIYQFWNVVSLPRSLVARSWVVSILTEEESKEINVFYKYVIEGKKLPKKFCLQIGGASTGIDRTRLEYEREFVLSDESFDHKVRDPVKIGIGSMVWRVFDEIVSNYAADDPESDRQSFIVCNKDYLSCSLDKPFVSLRKDADPGVLVFSWAGRIPKEWHITRNTRVTLHDRKTRQQIGEGEIDVKKKEIVIDCFDGLESLESPVSKACDAVIVLSKNGDN